MIHIKAIAIGLVVMTMALGVVVAIVKYQEAGMLVAVLFAAYCIGRGALDLKPRRRS